jgi:hypothetical protein
MIGLEEAIAFTVESAKTEPTMQCSHDFRSAEALTSACDPVARGVRPAAHNRAATKRFATTGEWQSTPEDVEAELATLASEGHVMPRCCGGSCGLPRVEVAS